MYSIVSADEVRPLPPRPDINWERKRARKLARVSGEKLKLDEARLLVARSYGFATWNKLAEYYRTWDVHARTGPRHSWDGMPRYENRVASISVELRNRKAFSVQPPDIQGTGASLATYVPRLFGLDNDAIFAADITEAEIRHAVARSERFSNWDALAAYAKVHQRSSREDRHNSAQFRASDALKANDRKLAQQLFSAHPELLGTDDPHGACGSILYDVALRAIREPTAESIESYHWVQSLGVDFQRTLNELLLGSMRMPAQEVQNLLDFGANPNWMPNNGYSVLEHAVYRYWSGEPVDLIAKHVTPRPSFWLAAGLGDVDTMTKFIDANGVPSKSARADRPPFAALWLDAPNRPDASDRDVVWEAFMLACMNHRVIAIDALLDRGFPIDYAPHEMNMLCWAVGNRYPDVVETLIERGADPTYKIWPSVSSAREMAKHGTQHDAENPVAHRIYGLCTR